MTQMDDLAGKKLGDYRLEHKLTSGGMAHIYVGKDEKLGRKAAIKVLTTDMAGEDETLRERFEREARAIARLEHDSIVPIYQFGQEDNLYFLAMRFIEGNDLADEMKTHKERGEYMDIERALNILDQVASALDYAHTQGIIHRDVKPSNVLLGKQGTEDKAVLSDFGLVLWQSVDQTMGTAFGTPRYISPEQATDSQSAVPQSDIYSLAVIVYEILTNEVMFEGNTPMEVALAHITETPTPPRTYNADIPADAQNELMKALQKDATKRHSTAREFINAIKEAYNINDTTATKPPRGADFDRDTGTIPVRADIGEETNAEKLKQAWDDDKATQKDRPDGLTTENDDSPNYVLIGGGAVAIFAILGVVIALLAGGDGGSPAAGAASGSGSPVMLRYNDNYFALINPSEDLSVDVSNLTIRGASSDETGSNFGGTIEPQGCFLIQRATSDTRPDWDGCEQVQVTISGEAYWRADGASEQEFTVSQNNATIRTCETVGRAVERTGELECEFRLG